MQQAEHCAAACICAVRALAGVIGGLAGDVTQDVPAAVIDAQVARRIWITGGFQVCQHLGGEPAASIPGTMDGGTDPTTSRALLPPPSGSSVTHHDQPDTPAD